MTEQERAIFRTLIQAWQGVQRTVAEQRERVRTVHGDNAPAERALFGYAGAMELCILQLEEALALCAKGTP